MKRGKGSPSSRKRLVCVVEGHGEVAALPSLCARIITYLEAWDWGVDSDPIRQPRSKLVNEQIKSPKRPPNQDGISRVLSLVKARPGDAALIVCDADDDCPATWGPAAEQLMSLQIAGKATMIVREYETWLLLSLLKTKMIDGRPIEGIRDAKGALARVCPGYKPALHQVELTRNVDIQLLLELSASFRKLVKNLAMIFGRPLPSGKPNKPDPAEEDGE